jgi:hypothetical protein
MHVDGPVHRMSKDGEHAPWGRRREYARRHVTNERTYDDVGKSTVRQIQFRCAFDAILGGQIDVDVS